MNDLLKYHNQRLKDRYEIQNGSKQTSHSTSKNQYIEKERIRQKKQNLILNGLKKMNSFPTDFKHALLSSIIQIMNLHLQGKQQISQQQICIPENLYMNTQKLDENINLNNLRQTKIQFQYEESTIQEFRFSEDKISQNITNFYQVYINLFVNFFNKKSETVNPNIIRSIIRPNNRYVIIDLLKSLLEFSRNEIKNIIKQTKFYQSRKYEQKICLQKVNLYQVSGHQVGLQRQSPQKSWQISQCQSLSSSPQHPYRRILTQPQLPCQSQNFQQPFQFIRTQSNQSQPYIQSINQFNIHKHNFTKNNSIQSSKSNKLKLFSQIVHGTQFLDNANFVQKNIRQLLFQKNFNFVNNINLENLQTKTNHIYNQLMKLNQANNQIISNYYQQNLGKKSKFNFYCQSKGLYSQKQVQIRKDLLNTDINLFNQRNLPNIYSNNIQLTQYSQQYIKRFIKTQQLTALQKDKKLNESKVISNWLPLKLQFTKSIMQPLQIEIQEININTGQFFSYHWKKYKKEFRMCQFFKQKVKNQFERLKSHQQRHKSHQQKLKSSQISQNYVNIKKKFRKSLFIDSNRKKTNQFLQNGNNKIFTKKQSIFPLLKGIQQNFIKNINQPNYSIGSSLSNPYRQIRSQSKTKNNQSYQSNQKMIRQNIISQKSKRDNIISEKSIQNNIIFEKSIRENIINEKSLNQVDKQKKIQSLKKNFQMRQKTKRKFSDSQKFLQKIAPHEKQKTQILQKLSKNQKKSLTLNIKTNINKYPAKYQKKNMITMSRDLNIKTDNFDNVNSEKAFTYFNFI